MGVHKENQCPFEIVKATANMLEHFRQLIFQKNSMKKKLKSYVWCWSLLTSFDPFKTEIIRARSNLFEKHKKEIL